MSDYTVFNKTNVLRFMIANTEEHRDCVTGCINATELAEDAARHFDVDDEDGCLDDETHWIWDAAIEAIAYDEAFSRTISGSKGMSGRYCR